MRLLILSSIVILLSFTVPLKKCDDIQYDIKILHTTGGLNNGKIEITITKSSSSVSAYLYGDVKSKNKLNVKIDQLNNLKTGVYILVLQNKECSTVQRDIIIR